MRGKFHRAASGRRRRCRVRPETATEIGIPRRRTSRSEPRNRTRWKRARTAASRPWPPTSLRAATPRVAPPSRRATLRGIASLACRRSSPRRLSLVPSCSRSSRSSSFPWRPARETRPRSTPSISSGNRVIRLAAPLFSFCLAGLGLPVLTQAPQASSGAGAPAPLLLALHTLA